MIVVTGATGNVGRTLVPLLAETGQEVTAVSRRPAAAVAEGVRYEQADLAAPERLRPVLNGAEALFLLIAGSGDHLRPRDVLDVAKAGGVRRVVLLSSQAAATRPSASSHAPLRAFEVAVRDSGLDWTILRPGGFHSNAFGWAEMVRTARTVAAPYGDVGLPVIDPADIAEVAAAALREGSHAGRTYELTGPALVTPREQAGAIGAAIGTPVEFVELSREEARGHLLQVMPEPVVDGTLDILGEPTEAEVRLSPDVGQVLGRAPRSFAEWAVRNAGTFR